MSHLTYDQRYTISVMLQSRYSQSEIANVIGKNKSVISREVKRNCDGRNGKYNHEVAQRKCDTRHKKKPKFKRLTPQMLSFIIQNLEEKLSREQIKGVSVLRGIDCVSHEWIYQMIWADKRRKGHLHKHLRNRGRPYSKRGAAKDKRGLIPNRLDISERPEVVELRERFGDLEIDTIIGENHKGAILTINDRMTGVLRMHKLQSRNSHLLAQKTIEVLEPWRNYLETITSDNGPEFREHQVIAKVLNVDFYFARPYHSWERGSNENLNGLIRQYIPKGTDFNEVSDEFITFVENELNDRPRKSLGIYLQMKCLTKRLHLWVDCCFSNLQVCKFAILRTR